MKMRCKAGSHYQQLVGVLLRWPALAVATTLGAAVPNRPGAVVGGWPTASFGLRAGLSIRVSEPFSSSYIRFTVIYCNNVC